MAGQHRGALSDFHSCRVCVSNTMQISQGSGSEHAWKHDQNCDQDTRLSANVNHMHTSMYAARRVSDCRPAPPMPTSRAFPPGSWMMRAIRATCSSANCKRGIEYWVEQTGKEELKALKKTLPCLLSPMHPEISCASIHGVHDFKIKGRKKHAPSQALPPVDFIIFKVYGGAHT